MTKILITGGSGFIGTNLILYLQRFDDVTLLNVDIEKPSIRAQTHIWKNIDIRNKDNLENVVVQFAPDIIIHLAARTDLEGSKLEDYNSNTLGVSNLVDVIKRTKSVRRAIFASSMLVCKPGYIPRHPDDYTPATIYGESKVLSEKIIKNAHLTCNWAIVRPTSIWGPWFKAPYRNFFDMVISKKYFHIGNKSATKTYGYIGNTIYQLEKLIYAPAELIQGQIFYLGDYEPYNIEGWADEIALETSSKVNKMPFGLVKVLAMIGDSLKVLKINFPMSSFRLKNMTTDNVVDLSNMQAIAPDLPFTRIDGIKETLKWLRR